MKKILSALFILTISTPVFAGGNHHRGHDRGGDRWVAPLVGGIILGALVSRQQDVVVEERPVYIAPQLVTPHYPIGPQTYNCMVRIYNPETGLFYNQVMTCVR